MAIYHLTASVISRARGQSVVAAAAYRLGAQLRDLRYGVTLNYVGKRGVVHSQIMAPTDAPPWVYDRQTLWNAVETAELRKDSQLARLVEIGLPVELSHEGRVALMRDYIVREFTGRGMIADFCIRGDAPNPHAHVLLTLRSVSPNGFGPKQRLWNGKAVLRQWRAAWAERANEHLALAGHEVRIDHRTLEAQHIELTPGRRVGVGPARLGDPSLPPHLAERIGEQQRIAHQNGLTILEDPTVALRALTHHAPTFTHPALARFLRGRTSDEAQFAAAWQAVTSSPYCIALDPDGGGHGRFTSRDMIEAQASLLRRAASMAVRRGHGIGCEVRDLAVTAFQMGELQRRAYGYLVDEGDAKAIAVAAAMRAVLLDASQRAWEAAGYAVSTTRPGGAEPDPPDSRTVLWIDGAHLLRLKELERILATADHARAKTVLVADVGAVRAMPIDAPFRRLLCEIGTS